MNSFDIYRKQNESVVDDGSVYSDILNHCKDSKNFLSAFATIASKPSIVHECTHNINSQLRKEAVKGSAAFYVRKNRCVVIDEPNCNKQDAVTFVPEILRLNLFAKFMLCLGKPLDVFDEWVAYVNQAYAAIDLARKGYKSKEDEVFGALELVAYVTGILMAADKKGVLSQKLIDFARWHLRQAFNAYFLGRYFFSRSEENEALLPELQIGTAWSEQREFLKSRIGFVIPDQFEENENDLQENGFDVIDGKITEGDFKIV